MKALGVQSLRDKLIKAGLVTEEQARQAEKKEPRKSGQPSSPPDEKASTIPKLPPLPLPGSKAHQRRESLRQLEIDRQLREWVLASQVSIEPGLRAFYFMTRKGKLRRWELSENQAQLLEEGKLTIVERREPAGVEHSLVSAETAEKMLALSEKSVRFYNRKDSPIGFVSEEGK